MMLTITERHQGETIALTAHLALPGATYEATIAGRIRRAMVDGILWWALGRTLDHLAATCMHQVYAAPTQERNDALHAAEALVHYMTHTSYHEADDHRATRIMRVVMDHMPDLAPLATVHPAAMPMYQQAHSIAKALLQRIEHSYGDVLHGVREGWNVEGMAA